MSDYTPTTRGAVMTTIDHEPFDGTVPWVEKISVYPGDRCWRVVPVDDDEEVFTTWREAMNYATKEDHR